MDIARPVSRGRPGSAAPKRPSTASRNRPSQPTTIHLDTAAAADTDTAAATRIHVPLVGTPVLRSVGDRIKVKLPSWRSFYPGIITDVNMAEKNQSDGQATYNVTFDDNERKCDVTEDCIMQTTSTADLSSSSTSSTATATAATTSSTVSSPPRRPGDAVMARIPGWSRPYHAIINRVNTDGTYDLTFPADGDKVNGVTEDVFVNENNNNNNNNEVG